MPAPVGRWRIVASRQRGIRSRVGPARALTGAAITRVAARWAAASVATVTEAGRPAPAAPRARARTTRGRGRAAARRRTVEHASRSRPGRSSRGGRAGRARASRCGRSTARASSPELVVQRRARRRARRGEVLREELEPEPPVAAHEARSRRPVLGVRDRRLPVDRDPEAPRSQAKLLRAGRESDGDARAPAPSGARAPRAAFGGMPPTSIPAMWVPFASLSAEPAKTRPRPIASRPPSRPRPSRARGASARTHGGGTKGREDAATRRGMVAGARCF